MNATEHRPCEGADHPEEANARLIAALRAIVEGAPESEPEYQDWGGDTEEAENWGLAHEHWRLAEIARGALKALEEAGA